MTRDRLNAYFRPVLAALAAAVTLAACDRTPAELDELLREEGLRQLQESAAVAGPGSAERVVLDVAARLGAGPAEPAPTIPDLDQLFDLALQRVAERRGRANAEGLLARQRALEAAAWEAIQRGDDEAGQRELAAARANRARTMVEQLGNGFAVAYVAVVGLGVERAESEAAAGGPSANGRLRRMAGSARNLHGDAGRALLEGNAATALDVAGHAAGLVNTLFNTLQRSR